MRHYKFMYRGCHKGRSLLTALGAIKVKVKGWIKR